MSLLAGLRFDCFLPRMREQNPDGVYRRIAEHIAPLCGTDVCTLKDIFSTKEHISPSAVGGKVAIIDVRSSLIKTPVVILGTTEHEVDFHAQDNEAVDIFAAVVSPTSYGPLHLQRLAAISRLLRNEELCEALREARDPDTMSVLMMPTQRWMSAA